MGAWIETLRRFHYSCPIVGSHPVWVRGLKPCNISSNRRATMSHPVWVRGLKQ